MSRMKLKRRGGYNPYAKNRKAKTAPVDPNQERLVCCAIERDGTTHGGGYRTHADLRRALGDSNPYQPRVTDRMGYLTSTGRFVGRIEAAEIARLAGQTASQSIELLSCDVDW